jgi:CMP-N-acetylneuraminic acid synthetase
LVSGGADEGQAGVDVPEILSVVQWPARQDALRRPVSSRSTAFGFPTIQPPGCAFLRPGQDRPDMRHKLVALMPMRHSSERIPGKNYRPFGDGRPLFQHMLDVLVATPGIDKVVIDTDSETVFDICRKQYPQVVLIERPAHLRDGATPMNNVLLYDTTMVDSEFYLQTHSTNPLLTRETLTRAVEKFFANYPINDSLFSVTRVQSRLWDQLARAVNHNPSILLRTQDLPPIYDENSCIYIFDKRTLVERQNRIGYRPTMFEMSPFEAQDIDEEINWAVAEAIFHKLNPSKGASA